MPERIIGILGGMGPEATADLFLEIIRLSPAKRDQDHFPVLIFSNPVIPDRTNAILGRGEDPVPVMVQSALRLQEAGAGILAVPCNAAHYFLPRVESCLSIPVINMIEETCSHIRSFYSDLLKVGLLAATGTVLCGVYRSACQKSGLELIEPDETSQAQVHQAITEVKQGVHNLHTELTLESVGADLVRRGAGAVILGCTEIPLALKPGRVDYPCINATRILAQAAVDWASGRS
jgi:aspartate racemase